MLKIYTIISDILIGKERISTISGLPWLNSRRQRSTFSSVQETASEN